VAAAQAAAAEGRFGQALAVGERYAVAERNPIYFVVPMTVECWAKVGAAAGPDKARSSPTILLANEPRHSQTHWELYAQKDSGVLAAAMPGWDAKEVLSKQTIVDGRWHHVAMVFDGKSLRLYCDGAEVASAPVKKVAPYPDTGPLTFGHLPGVEANHDLLLDEVRISRVARPVGKPADAPFQPDADTIGLWHFDESADTFADASLTRNPAKLTPVEKQAPAGGGFDGTLGTRTRWSDMDYGPFFSSTLLIPSEKQNVTHKAISVRLDDKHAVAFDTELLRVSAAWSGNFLSLKAFREGLGGPPDVAGQVLFSTAPAPGWSRPGTSDFTDPRPDRLGPLPREWGHYRGLYVNDGRVVFSYTVGGRDVLDAPSVETRDGKSVITRTIEVGPGDQPVTLRAADAGPWAGGKDLLGFELVNPRAGVKIESSQGWLGVSVPAANGTTSFTLRLRAGSLEMRNEAPAPVLPSTLVQGGPSRYPPLTTKGSLGPGGNAYTVDTLTPPTDNPWKSFLRFGGLDFFSNGDAAVCSVSGDVWVVSGINETLTELKWRRYATGLFQPLGLRIVDDAVYVLGRDQITRLHDLNHDGEADFYENFNNDAKVTTNAHGYVTCLETDPAGNFYYLKCGDNTEHGGTVLRVSKDGQKLDVFATGLRNPNGLGVSPTGVVTEADNQGEWVPASRLDVVKPGQFLGFQPMSKRNPPPTDPGTPLCWMPQNVDNSSGGQAWVPDERWGPFKDYMVHTSYGGAAMLLVLQDKGDGPPQGGVVRFPFTFDSGVMRARFRKQDGQLYVCGLRGWQTAGVKDACLQRVRYTGKPVYIPSGIAFTEKGIRLSFTCPLAADVANDADSYSILRWNYHWTAEYGSRQWSISDPTRQGYDTVKVTSAKLQPDGRTVVLEVEDMRAAMQIQVGYDLEASDGTQVRGDVYGTAHVLRR
jgi:hypothetical protein